MKLLKKYKKLRGIYRITNIKTNKIYIGSSVNIYKRLGRHINSLKQNKHPNILLQRLYNKYGLGIFKFKVICKNIKNITMYCDKNDLATNGFRRMVNGGRPQYRGYKLYTK